MDHKTIIKNLTTSVKDNFKNMSCKTFKTWWENVFYECLQANMHEQIYRMFNEHLNITGNYFVNTFVRQFVRKYLVNVMQIVESPLITFTLFQHYLILLFLSFTFPS